MPGYDWHWLRAQCFVESRFDTRARSPAGAMGICQFMPGTWGDAQKALGVSNVWAASENIYAAGWYMQRQLGVWTWRRTDIERLELAQAGYNAGVGNILRAQRLCGGAASWNAIKVCLPAVTGRHAEETVGYVAAISRWRLVSLEAEAE